MKKEITIRDIPERHKCSKCKKIKSSIEFGRYDKNKNGLRSSCRSCDSEASKTYSRKRKAKEGSLRDIWKAMRRRCQLKTSLDYQRWGGRGIKVCNEWDKSFDSFKLFCEENGWIPGLQVDRENNDGNYQPGNIRFVTQIENIRNSTVAKLTIKHVSEIKTLIEDGVSSGAIAKKFNISKTTVNDIKAMRTWRDVQPTYRAEKSGQNRRLREMV